MGESLVGKVFVQNNDARYVKVLSETDKNIVCVSTAGTERTISKKTFQKTFIFVPTPDESEQNIRKLLMYQALQD